jgi:hypothetical protein
MFPTVALRVCFFGGILVKITPFTVCVSLTIFLDTTQNTKHKTQTKQGTMAQLCHDNGRF